MKSISKGKRNYDKQMAVGYMAYMMGGSYFHRCRCKSPVEEKHLFLHYAEMPTEKQYQYEEKILKSIEAINPVFLQMLGSLNCEAFCYHRHGEYRIDFRTGGFESIRFVIRNNGSFSIIPFWG